MSETTAGAVADFLYIILSVFDRNRHCQRLILCETESVALDDMIRFLLKGDKQVLLDLILMEAVDL